MPDAALPEPRQRVTAGEDSTLFLRCPRGARVTPSGSAGDNHCSICDCGRRTDTDTKE